ncbi:ATP-dependent RNA helicase DEAH12, chloroplastic, partial [Geodia barretti]
MLLAFIKQCLPSRNDLKLVIMSATIEPELFVKYFEKCEKENDVVSTIRVSGRTFPVEVEYDPLHSRVVLSADSDYVMRAVEVVRTIHNKQPPGDILVFLTCAPEIERACKEVEYYLQHEAVVLPLHGKLPPEEQQKVFDESIGRRKVIFSTNVAETSVTIPGVKYVVDTGLSKEMHFDSRKNMDSLEVCMISKSSAEQRKGRAGRVSSGKCYRLYTVDDYASKMPDRSKPEILRIQLSHVVLKMLEFGVPNVLTFDFVEHPDRNALEAAVDTLKSVGAIEDSNLTELGRKMAVLPLQPQLSKVLLDGVSKEVGTEALVSVALSSLSGQVFFRGGTDEMKEESDKKKLHFCHPLGDQMTNLSVYQCWQGVDKSKQRKWCFEQFVNAKSMRVVEDMVKELRHILLKKLKITLSLIVESLDAAECYLGKLYFDAFVNNLAVYLGHQRAGYMTTALRDSSSSFLIFPGSSLNHLGCTPKYVLYEKTLKTSRQFLTQVMSVKQEWIDEAVATGRLTEDPAVTYANHMVLPLHVVCTGPQTLKEMRLKRIEVLETVAVHTGPCTIAPFFDLSPEPKQWGVIRVIAQRKDHDALQLVVASTVGDIQQQYKEQTKEFSLTNEQDWTRAVIGAGGTVQQMIMPYQFRSVIVVSNSESESPEKITSCLQKYGKVKTTKMMRNDANGLRLCVTYSTASEAKRAIKEFDSPTVRLYPQKGQQFTLRLEWERRERATHASLSFDSPQHCNTALMELGFSIAYMGFKIKILLDKYSHNKLFMSSQILCLCEEQSLIEEIRRRVSPNFSLKMGYKKYDNEYPYLQPHGRKNRRPHAQNAYVLHSEDGSEADDSESSSEEDETVNRITEGELKRFKESMEAYIKAIIRVYVEQGTFRVNFVIPREWDIRFRAYVTFDDPDEGYKLLYSDLDQECINEKKLCVSPNLKCLLSFKQEVYTLIFDDLDKARKDLLRRYLKLVYIKVIPPDKKVQNLTRISLTAYDVKVFSVAQRELYEAGQLYTLHCNTTELQEYMLCHDSHKHLQDTKETTSTYICRDPSTMVIKIYGDGKNKEAAKAAIEEKAKQLFSDGALVTDLGLRGEGKAPGLMKHLVTRYGCDLNGMLEFEGVRRITLNPHLHLLSVLATERGLDAIRKCVEEVSVSSQVVQRKMEGEYDFECVACFTTIDEPKEIVRLECCGHAFHTDCIKIQLKPDTLTLPVRCAKEDCSEEFVLKDFENLQKKLKTFRMPVLVSAAIQ